MGMLKNLFGKEEKKSSCCDMKIVEVEDDKASCDCGGVCEGAIELTVMGPGCAKCHKLKEAADEAASESSRAISVDYVIDPAAMAEAGVMSTPALLVDGKVVSQGKVLSADEILGLI